MSRRAAISVLIWLMWSLPAAAQSEAGFRAWMASCDNLRSCYAYALAPEGEASDGFLRLRRGGAADAPVEAAIVLTDGPAGTAFLSFDAEGDTASRPLSLEPSDPGARADIPPGQVDWLIAGLRRANVLIVRRNGSDAPVTLSLSGASAALRWMDDRQRRAGTVTALVARGDRPASDVPAVPPEPIVTRARIQNGTLPQPPAALDTVLRDECSVESRTEPDGLRLAPGLILWSAVCDRGAYNEGVIFFLARDGEAALQPVVFEMPPALAAYQKGNILVNSGIEPDGTVGSFSKGRGIADCGSAGTWAWDGQAFRLVSFSAMPSCRGVTPDEWPVLWRARLK